MLRFLSFFSFFTFVACSLMGQTAEGCDGMRYVQTVFSDVRKTTVTYGSNTNQGNANITLQMDVYEPIGDMVSKRPAVVLAHGGSFVLGNKTDLTSQCEDLARRGFVAASISYRLYPFLTLGFPDSAQVLTTAVMAMGDMKAAIRYLREDAATTNQFKVDANYVFSGGYSAGSIVGIGVGMLDSTDTNVPQFIRDVVSATGGFEGNSANNLSYSSEVVGVLNRSGGIYRKEWIDVNDPVMCSIHGTADDVVFYNTGLANGLLYLDGSGVMHPHMEAIGLRNYLNTVQGGGHTDVYFTSGFAPDYEDFTTISMEVFNEILCGVSNSSEPISNQAASWKIQPNPSRGTFSITYPSEKGSFDIQIINTQGRVVFEKTNMIGTSDLQISFSNGLYYVRLTNVGSQTSIGKLLIQN